MAIELKKAKDKDVHRMRGLFFNVGLGVALLITLMAFNYSQVKRKALDIASLEGDLEEVIEIPNTIQKPLEPPPVQDPEFVPVPDEVELDEQPDYDLDTEPDEVAPDFDPDLWGPEDEEIEVPLFEGPIETPAQFPGGEGALYAWLAQEIDYPTQAIRMNIEGRVFVSFVVGPTGEINDVKLVKGISPDCDQEAVAAIKRMPNWTPPRQRGRADRQRIMVPVIFRLAH